MPQPQIDPDFDGLTFRDRPRRGPPRDDATSLFWKGVAIFIVVALIHPFYSYAVQTRLLARDVEDATAAFVDEMDRKAVEATREAETQTRESAETSLARRLRTVGLAGSTVIRGQRVVIVTLGQASFAEAGERICALAARQFRTPLSGERLRVQGYHGRNPATDIGILTCP